MFIFAIDPGSEHSGVVLYDSEEHKVLWSSDEENTELLKSVREPIDTILWHVGHPLGPEGIDSSVLAIEGLENQGHFVGKSTFETAEWIGRFREAWESGTGQPSFRMSRRDVKICLCGGSTYTDPDSGARRTVNDTAVANAVRGRFPETGGGSRPVVGTKAKPGPLYGMKGGHQYSALAIALTWVEMYGNKEKGNQNETE